MKILTVYGNIDYDDLDEFELSKETLDYLSSRKAASEIFFASEIDLRGEDDEFASAIQEVAEVAIAENKFSEPSRAFAIADHCNVGFGAVEELRTNAFEVEGAEYYVLLDDEADEMAKDMARSLLDDIGIEGMSDSFKSYVYDNFVNTKWFDDAMEESHTNYAHDIESEDASSDEYINRLHEEMVEKGVMDEPEWPDESDFEDDEDGYEEARSKYADKLESDVSSNIDDFVSSMSDDYDDGLDYWKQVYGSEEISEIVNKNNLVDLDEVAEYLVDTDGRGQTIASYDNEEHYIKITYRNDSYEYYIYRTN
jgi:hypothetical protein